ncbi:dual specificity protein phosphatase family protein [Ahniella affigens]|nr:sulfur transferase domain-containing protein [Ahniella affigens]
MLLSACATNPPKQATEVASVLDQATAKGSIIIAAQPTEGDLHSLKARGISHVINLRSDEEMASLNFAESDLVAMQGIQYQHLPIAASSDYQPAVLKALQNAVDSNDGKVLVHCASGGRAAMLYAAYAMQHEGLSPDAAMRTLASAGAWPLALERLTGRKLKVVFAEDDP